MKVCWERSYFLFIKSKNCARMEEDMSEPEEIRCVFDDN